MWDYVISSSATLVHLLFFMLPFLSQTPPHSSPCPSVLVYINSRRHKRADHLLHKLVSVQTALFNWFSQIFFMNIFQFPILVAERFLLCAEVILQHISLWISFVLRNNEGMNGRINGMNVAIVLYHPAFLGKTLEVPFVQIHSSIC